MSSTEVKATVKGLINVSLEFEIPGGFVLAVSNDYYSSVKDRIGENVEIEGYIRPNADGVMTLFPNSEDFT